MEKIVTNKTSNKKQRRNMYIGTLILGVLLACFLFSYFALGKESSELKLVHVLFRHGDRTPTETYKKDPYVHYPWPDGWGALTKKGKQQLYELGKTLNFKYKDFIGESFSPNQVYVQTSDADRCHMSGAALLAGMFPPNKDQVWNDDLKWQPFALHSLPRALDNIVAMKRKCPSYDKALVEAYNSDEIQKLNEHYKDLYAYLTEVTGQDMSNITAVEFLFNTLEIEELNKLSLPEWTKKVYPDKIKDIATRSLAIFTETPFMRKMKGGVLLREIVQNTKLKIESPKSNKKFYLYSAHDITIVNFLRSMGFLDNLKPDYGAAFVIEIHSSDAQNEIKFQYYNSSSTIEPHKYIMDACGDPCWLDNFYKATDNLVPKDWEKECQITI